LNFAVNALYFVIYFLGLNSILDIFTIVFLSVDPCKATLILSFGDIAEPFYVWLHYFILSLKFLI